MIIIYLDSGCETFLVNTSLQENRLNLKLF